MMSLMPRIGRQPALHLSLPAISVPHAKRPRITIRDQRASQPLLLPDAESLTKLALQVKEKKIHPVKLSVARSMPSTSNVLSPREIVRVPYAELPAADTASAFGTGVMRFPVGARGKDRFVQGQVKVQTKKPGEGPFTHVKKGAYDVRGLKYLFAISSDGVHIKREMSYASSNRGIVCHPKITPFASLGGEVWFLREQAGNAVHINLNSGRFPSKSDEDIYAVAKVWLALGYDRVYVTPRDQRYGTVTPLLFMVDQEQSRAMHTDGIPEFV